MEQPCLWKTKQEVVWAASEVEYERIQGLSSEDQRCGTYAAGVGDDKTRTGGGDVETGMCLAVCNVAIQAFQ